MDARHGVEGVAGAVLGSVVPRRLANLLEGALHEEQALAHPVMAANELLVAIVAQAETTAFLLFGRREVTDRPALRGCGRCCSGGRRRREDRRARWWDR